MFTFFSSASIRIASVSRAASSAWIRITSVLRAASSSSASWSNRPDIIDELATNISFVTVSYARLAVPALSRTGATKNPSEEDWRLAPAAFRTMLESAVAWAGDDGREDCWDVRVNAVVVHQLYGPPPHHLTRRHTNTYHTTSHLP